MFKLGDLAVYDNGVDLHMVEIKAFYPDTDEYEVEFCLKSLYPRRMIVHEKTLEDFVPNDGTYKSKTCECGAAHTSFPEYHAHYCPLNKRGYYV